MTSVTRSSLGSSLATLALAAGAVLAGSCSIVAAIDDGPAKCALLPGEPDPCPDGYVCADGRCTLGQRDGGDMTCTPRDETCNGLDDDCDERTDEDALSDKDGDGYTWCGSGTEARRDCNDANDAVHPEAVESCDGIDNDCDIRVDEEPPAVCQGAARCIDGECRPTDCSVVGCPDGMSCDVSGSTPRCVAGSCVVDGCPRGQACDRTLGTCFTLARLGESCDFDGQCETDSCFPRESLMLGAGRICGKACCADGDCPPDTMCWAPGTGARSCVPLDVLGRSTGNLPLGTPCEFDAECASAYCRAGLCRSACTRGDQCDGPDLACRLTPSPLPDGRFDEFLCAPPAGRAEFGGDCDSDEDCASGFCIQLNELVDLPAPTIRRCTKSCADSTDCTEVRDGAIRVQTFCGHVFAGDEVLQVCLPTLDPDGSASGSSCDEAADCRDRSCLCPRGGTCETRVCADTCCNDAGCSVDSTRRRCRPHRVGSAWLMHCRE